MGIRILHPINSTRKLIHQGLPGIKKRREIAASIKELKKQKLSVEEAFALGKLENAAKREGLVDASELRMHAKEYQKLLRTPFWQEVIAEVVKTGGKTDERVKALEDLIDEYERQAGIHDQKAGEHKRKAKTYFVYSGKFGQKSVAGLPFGKMTPKIMRRWIEYRELTKDQRAKLSEVHKEIIWGKNIGERRLTELYRQRDAILADMRLTRKTLFGSKTK
jgi:hypothetical protein